MCVYIYIYIYHSSLKNHGILHVFCLVCSGLSIRIVPHGLSKRAIVALAINDNIRSINTYEFDDFLLTNTWFFQICCGYYLAFSFPLLCSRSESFSIRCLKIYQCSWRSSRSIVAGKFLYLIKKTTNNFSLVFNEELMIHFQKHCFATEQRLLI